MAYTTIDNPTKFFNTVTYSGNGSATQAITGVGFQPDWVWIKSRNNSSESHMASDAVRGSTKRLRPDTHLVEDDLGSNGIQSFDTDGFTAGDGDAMNASSQTYVAWNWLGANGTSSNSDGGITSTVIYLDTNGAAGGSSVWNDTTPTSSVFTVNDNQVNKSSINYIAYCFTEIKGFSKFGKYTSNNTANDGPFIYTGFLPAFVMTKISTVGGAHWRIFDNRRESFNGDRQYLQPDNAGSESNQDPSQMDFVSNGFKLRGAEGDSNYNTETVFYWAFAEAPFVTVGTKAAGTAR